MSFYDLMPKYPNRYLQDYLYRFTDHDILRVLSKDRLSPEDFLALISPMASNHLEKMAVKAHDLTARHFGNAIVLYAPMYIANYCVNKCLYCSFNHENQIERKSLSIEEFQEEAKIISAGGIRHILLLTGESRKESSPGYIKEIVTEAKRYFTSISLEIYPLSQDEYETLIASGADGITIYQEVYDKNTYQLMHPFGPKRNYRFRLETPERACMAGFRSLGIGTLLGLGEWRSEAFYTALHAQYLTHKYPEVELSLSLPRIRPHASNFNIPHPVGNREFVQILLAYRLYLPHAGITISTRERADFRDNLLGLGVTRMSAGSVTEVGGYSKKSGQGQFEVSDERSIFEIGQMLLRKGYQPVFKDWQYF
ncbi:MAG: 2-iminoacetate synthase ThiH [Syntrophomonadaceae bacterium]|jgi:2-iminoacetate synthase